MKKFTNFEKAHTPHDWGKCVLCGTKDNYLSWYKEYYKGEQIDGLICNTHRMEEEMGCENPLVLKIAIDADSLIYKACHRHQEPFDIEMAYYEFCQEVGKICNSIFSGKNHPHEYDKDTKVQFKVVFSPKKSFRNKISPAGAFNEKGKALGYKANRKSPTIEGISLLKNLVMERMPNNAMYVAGVEADDVVIYFAKHKGWMVAAIDKDVISACPTHCYNYNKYTWENPKSDLDIEMWYLWQTMVGDSTDNVLGALGVGKAGADKVMNELDFPDFERIAEEFEYRQDAIVNHNLVRMDQWTPENGVVLWSPEDEDKEEEDDDDWG